MYNDYPTIYESTLNLNYIYIGILSVILLAIIILTFISLAKVFKKANRSGISAWIPLYNILVLLEITNKPKWYFIMMLFPILNLVFYINIMFSLAKVFRKSKTFAIGMIILPFVFLPILAFSDNEYFGINLIAMQGTNNVVNIPAVETIKEEPKIEEHLEKDQNLKNINISIGGGVYQKNYTNDLLQIDEKQAITKETEEQLLKIKEEQKNTVKKDNTFINKNLSTENTVNDNIIINNNSNKIEIPSIISDTNSNTNNDIVKTASDYSNIIISPPSDDNSKNQIKNIDNNNFNNEVKTNTVSNGYISCPKCGAKLNNGSTRCFLCGQNLT